MIFGFLDWLTVIVVCFVIIFLIALLIIRSVKKKELERVIKEEYGRKVERY